MTARFAATVLVALVGAGAIGCGSKATGVENTDAGTGSTGSTGASTTGSTGSGTTGSGTTGGTGGVDPCGPALRFDGAQQVIVTNDPALTLPASFSMLAWIRPSSAANSGAVFENGVRGSYYPAYFLRMRSGDGTLETGISPAPDGTGRVNAPGQQVLPLGEWTHVAVTYDSDALRLYVNGQLDTETVVGSVIPYAPTHDLWLGRQDWPTGQDGLIGDLSNLQLWRRPLDAGEVAEVMDLANNPADTTDRVANWRFEEGAGLITADAANGHDAVLDGPTWIEDEGPGCLGGAGGSSVQFDFENAADGAGQPVTLTTPASSMDPPFTSAEFRWTDRDGVFGTFVDHGVQFAGGSQLYRGRGLGTVTDLTYYFIELDSSQPWTLTGLSLWVSNNDGLTNEVQVTVFQAGVETLVGTFDLCGCAQSVDVPIDPNALDAGVVEIRLRPQGNTGSAFVAVDDIRIDFE